MTKKTQDTGLSPDALKRSKKLLTATLEKQLKPINHPDYDGDDPMILARLFAPVGSWTWYVTAGARMKHGDFIFYGYVMGDANEWGEFSLYELFSANLPLGQHIERDINFKPIRFSELKEVR